MRRVFKSLKSYTLLFLSLMVTGCHNSAPQVVPPVATVTEMKQVSLSAILQHPQEFLSQNVTVEGVFTGWSGKCHGAPPRTRSDWMLEQKDHCIYVSGAMPKGTSAQPPEKGIGKIVYIQGVVLIDMQNRPYI